jgi:hypothetical protein
MPVPPLALTVMMYDAVHRDWENGKWFILGAFSRLRFSTFPSTPQRINVFLSLIEVNGVYGLRLRIVDVADDDRPVHDFAGQLDGRDPLAPFEFFIPLVNVQFPSAEEYRLQLIIDGEITAERKLVLQDTSGCLNHG